MSAHILVIDDEEVVRKSFSLALEDSSYQVETVGSGEEGIERVRANRYDLIFLDLRMPNLDGVATLRQLRAIDLDVPIYIVTAFHAEFFSQLKRAAEDGLRFDVIEKPVGSARISLITRNVLESPQGIRN